MASSGSGEERTWTIYVCPVHPDAVRSLDSPPPGERPYCPHAKAEDPHKMQAIEVVPRAEREAREKATARIADLTDERDGLIGDNLRLEEDVEEWQRRGEKAEKEQSAWRADFYAAHARTEKAIGRLRAIATEAERNANHTAGEGYTYEQGRYHVATELLASLSALPVQKEER